jgi:hypothetical protein
MVRCEGRCRMQKPQGEGQDCVCGGGVYGRAMWCGGVRVQRVGCVACVARRRTNLTGERPDDPMTRVEQME